MKTEAIPLSTDSAIETDDPISIPLYFSGLVISLVGILAVNSALSYDQFGSTIMALTVVGYVFSIAYRWLRIKLPILEIIAGCTALFFGYRYFTHSFAPSAFIPPDVTQGDLIMAIILEWITVVRSWALTNDGSVVFTSVTSIAMIGLVGATDLNEELLVYFCIYMVFATFLLLHQTYLVQRSYNLSNAENISEAGTVKNQIILALSSGFVMLCLGLVVVVPLRAIGSHLSLATALKALVGNQHVSDSIVQVADRTLVLSDDNTFAIGSGSGDSASNQLVMRVVNSDRDEHYYRGRTYDVYERYGWSSSRANDFVTLWPVPTPKSTDLSAFVLHSPTQPGGDSTQPAGLYTAPSYKPLHSQFYIMSAGLISTLYLPYGTGEVDMPIGSTSFLRQFSDNCLTMSNAQGIGSIYQTFSYPQQPTTIQLRQAPLLTGNCPDIVQQYFIEQKGLDVVSSEDQSRLLQTAQMIVDALPSYRRTEFDRAEAIRAWVSHRCVYSLSVDPVPSNEDPVSYFLFRSRKGYCDLFSSSMAILCRYEGIPARIATGFAPGDLNKHEGYDLRERDKHAWVEVWFPHYGWIEFDPTVGTIADSSVTNTDSYSVWMAHEFDKLRLLVMVGGLYPTIIEALIALAAIYLFKIELLDKYLVKAAAERSAGAFKSLQDAKKSSEPSAIWNHCRLSARLRYGQFESALRRAGISRHPWQTPEEFMTAIREILVTHGSDSAVDFQGVLEAARLLTEEVMMSLYAPVELVADALLESEERSVGDAALKTIVGNLASIRTVVQGSKTKTALR